MELTKELLEQLEKIPAGNVADNNPHGSVMDAAIQAVNPRLHMIGRAFPVKCKPGDNLALHQGIHAAEKGDVLVFACEGYMHGGHFGDMMASACKKKGIAGVIVDGTIRDREDIIQLNFPVYSRGFCCAPTDKNAAAIMNRPVTAGGSYVRPGDLIFGDGDGVVVIPFEEEDEVIRKAVRKYHHEQEILKEIEAGKDTLEIYGFAPGDRE